MKTYELSYIVSPEITSEEAEAKAKEIESAISGKEGIILKQLNPIARTLSYPIKNRASGFFGVLEFQLEPEKLMNLKEILQKDGKIVRHMLIIKEALEMKKERRTRTKPEITVKDESSFAKASEDEAETSEKTVTKAAVKEKVELKDIEHELDELLGE